MQAACVRFRIALLRSYRYADWLRTCVSTLFAVASERRVLVFPTVLRGAQASGANVLLLFFIFFNYIFSGFCQTSYLNIRTGPIFAKFAGLAELCPEMNHLKLFLSISQGTLPWQPILWAKSTSIPHHVVRMTFARAAPPAYNKKGN